MIKNTKPIILITGSTGMLGLELVKVLKWKKFHVIEVRHKHGTSMAFDITSKRMIMAFKEQVPKLDAIIHLAAMTDVNRCELNKRVCFRTNVIGTRNMVNLAKDYGSKLIYISTPMIFSGVTGNYTETSRVAPLNYYSKTKYLGEVAVLKYNSSLIIRVNPIAVRPKGAFPSFIQWFVDVARTNQSFELFTDVRINPISTNTLSHVISKMLVSFNPGIIHLGSRDVANKADIWELIVANFSKFSGKVTKLSVNDTKSGRVARRPREMWLNVDKATFRGYKMPTWKTEVKKVLKELL